MLIFLKRRYPRLWLAWIMITGLAFPPHALAQQQTANARFVDVTQRAGIRFSHHNGAFGRKFLPEMLGPGCAFIDYDRDGLPDILLINGQDWPGHGRTKSTLKLYHNNGNGTL